MQLCRHLFVCLFVTQGGATCYLIFINAQGLISVKDGAGLSKKRFLSLSLPVSFEVGGLSVP